MRESVILIGFMGAGKSSVGKCLAELSGLPLLDTDELIERRAGMSISQIFARQGEEGFRRIESQVLEQLLSDDRKCVISVGGGLPLREENRRMLRQLGRVIFLRVKGPTVLKRLEGDVSRPLLQSADREARVHELLEFRNPVYVSAADLVIDADDQTPMELARRLYPAEMKN